MINDGLIYLLELRFPQHAMVQEWLNGTEYGERYVLVATNVSRERVNDYGRNVSENLFVPALKPRREEEEFMLILKGHEETQKLAEGYTAKILDFNRR